MNRISDLLCQRESIHMRMILIRIDIIVLPFLIKFDPNSLYEYYVQVVYIQTKTNNTIKILFKNI
jgi:hypothetical protein